MVFINSLALQLMKSVMQCLLVYVIPLQDWNVLLGKLPSLAIQGRQLLTFWV